MKNNFILILIFCLSACTTTNEIEVIDIRDFRAENEAEIRAYLSENELEAEETESGLFYIINNLGEGAQPDDSSSILVNYRGYFTNGVVFDQSADFGLPVRLSEVIPGWAEGLPLFREGGSGVLLIPAHLAFGSSNFQAIPGGSVVIFDIEILEVN